MSKRACPKIAICALLWLLIAALPALVSAQEGVSEDDIVRFRRRISAGGGAEIVLHRAPDAKAWSLRLINRSTGKTVSQTEFPEWAGADYYGYDVLIAEEGRARMVVFEAGPAPGLDAPPSAESWQVAWAWGEAPNESGRTWRVVAETKSTPLDGGDRLLFRDVDGKSRLVRIKTSDRTIFCGAKLGSFEVFDDRKLAFRTRLALDQLVEGATPLKASLPDEPFQESVYRNFYGWFSASSDRRNSDDTRTAPRPIELGDGELSTAWSEGAPGDGRGEFVTARISPALRMRGFRIVPGVTVSEDEYTAWSRPKSILISLSEGRRFTVELPDVSHRTLMSRNGVVVTFPEAVRTNCMSVVILESRSGSRPLGEDAWKREYSAISELTPFSELHGLPRDVAALVTVEMLLKQDDPRNTRRLSTLVSPLGDELVKQLRRVLSTGREEDRVRVVPLLRGLPSDEAVGILVSLFKNIPVSDRSYPLVKRALVPHREKAAEGLMKLHRSGAMEDERKRTDLVRLVGRLGTNAHLEELASELGDGSERLRNERARAVARGGTALLPILFETIAAEPDAPRAYDALRVVTSMGRQRFYRSQGVAPGSERLLVALDESTARRSQLLIIRALGLFETEGAVTRLARISRDAPDPLAREEAIEAVGRYSGRQARRAVELGLADRSPDVRIAAISAISERSDTVQSLPEVRVYVERETWRQGLADGFTLLAETGDPNSVEFLERAIARDDKGDRATLITAALERAEQPIGDGVLFQILSDDESDFLLVKNTIDLLGLSDTAASREVLAQIAQGPQFSDRFDQRKNETLRTRAMLGLGRRRSSEAAEILIDIVSDSSDPGTIRTALRGLSFMDDRSLIRRLQLMQTSAPESLWGDYEDTVESIDRRASIREVEEGIEELSEEAGRRASEVEEAPDKKNDKPEEER